MIDYEEMLEYVRKAKAGDEDAKTIVFKNNEPLIKSIIRRFKDKGVEYDDLYQIGCMGLTKAILNFDESFGVRFSTYTVPMIIGEIKRHIRDNGAIKVSRSLKILANKIGKFTEEYLAKNDRSPKVEEIAEHFLVSEDEVILAVNSSKMPLSLYDKFDDDEEGQELIDKIPSGSSEESLVDKIHLYDVISKLTDREKKLVIMRYFKDKTQSETAKCLGVSQVQVSRLENKIIEKMRLLF